ncbi:hypothetical protein AB0K15_28965 [Amycolatopsis sp. NPDC049253]|uniref:hypothetical protein n=1 Tax=Amycolatopsis sp. NPDC049253 TaxID=3155274 RepID=UPI00344262E2
MVTIWTPVRENQPIIIRREQRSPGECEGVGNFLRVRQESRRLDRIVAFVTLRSNVEEDSDHQRMVRPLLPEGVQ